MSRKRFTEAQVIETLYRSGLAIPCYRCRHPLYPGTKIEREHILEIALGGKDEPANCAYSHKLCHDFITNGSKATTAGSSKQRIAKLKRLTNPQPSKRPMKSPGFDKTRTRKFSGEVVRRGA